VKNSAVWSFDVSPFPPVKTSDSRDFAFFAVSFCLVLA
jgi:hypothetical protein